MYPNPKTRRGQILYQLLNAATVGISALYLILVISLPFAPKALSSGGFLDFSPALEAFFIFLYTHPIYVALLSILLCAKRAVCVKTNEKQDSRLHIFLNIMYWVQYVTALISLILYVIGFDDMSQYVFGIVLFELLLWVFIIILKRIESKMLKAEGKAKPTFDVNVYKNPLFIIAAVILVVAVLCIPCNDERASFEDDPNDYIYDRTNSFLCSYIKVEDRGTKEILDRKFLVFPFNHQKTDEIFGVR